jgi:4-hydroxybenzoate polyprenyltransferase
MAFLFFFSFGLLDSKITLLPSILYFLFALFFIWGPSSVINLYSDAETDNYSEHVKDYNLKMQPFTINEIGKKTGLIIFMFLSVIGFFIFYNINITVFVLTVLFSFLGIFYSLPPIRAKSVPIMDVIFNSTGGVIFYLLGWCLTENVLDVRLYTIFWSFFLLASSYLLTLYGDYGHDKKSNVKNTAILLGKSSTYKLSVVLFLLSLIFYFLTMYTYEVSWSYWFLMLLLIFSGYKLSRKFSKEISTKNMTENAMKKAIIMCIIIIIIIFIDIFLRSF